MLKWFYLVALFVSLICLVIFYNKCRNNTNKNYLLLFVATFIANYGYTMQAFSNNFSQFYPGYQIYYTSSLMASIFMFICIVELCGVRISKLITISIFTYVIFIIVCVSTIENSQLYYKSVSFQKIYGVSCIVKEYGPLHSLFVLFIIAMNVASLGIVAYAFVKKRKISKKTRILLNSIVLIATVFYVLPRLFHLPIEFLPFAYVVMEIVVIRLVNHLSLYDMTSSLVNAYEERKEYGYITFDTKKRIINYNDYALKIFPELANTRLEKLVQNKDSHFYKEILSYIDLWIENEGMTKTISVDDFSITCTCSYIMSNKKKIGFLIELNDETEANKYLEFLSIYNQQLEYNVEEKAARILQIQDSIITGMASMVESRDNSTGGHIKRTSKGVKIFLDHLKQHEEFTWLTEEFYENVIKSAPMHDLGKISVDDAILRKPAKFTEEEFEVMKTHTTEGAKIVLEVMQEINDKELKQIAMNIAHYHHEKWDGSGYPTKKAEEEIPVEARVMAFADVFDALVTKRCYKEAFSYEEAFTIIKEELGSHFDPVLGEVFLECRDDLEKMYTHESLVEASYNQQ